MKISVVGLASRTGGGLTVLMDLFEFANSSDNPHQWQFIVSDQQLAGTSDSVRVDRIAPEYKGLRSRLWAELTAGRRAVNEFEPDVVLSLQNIDTLARSKQQLAIYMHQALPFQDAYKLPKGSLANLKTVFRQFLIKNLILSSIRKAQATFVQTNWLALNLKDRAPDASIFPIGFDLPVKKNASTVEPYIPSGFFYPASPMPYKNHLLIHEAMKLLSESERNSLGQISLTLTPNQLLQVIGEENRVNLNWYSLLGWLSKSEMDRKYLESILVFPSLVESLGLPLYEARSKGISIVAAESAYSIEALDGYDRVKWFDPLDPHSLAQAMLDAAAEKNETYSSERDVPFNPNSWQLMMKILENQLY